MRFSEAMQIYAIIFIVFWLRTYFFQRFIVLLCENDYENYTLKFSSKFVSFPVVFRRDFLVFVCKDRTEPISPTTPAVNYISNFS